MTSFFPAEEKFMGETNYLKMNKIDEGDELRIRILTTPIIGWEDWTEEGKPVRFRPQDKPLNPINPTKKIKEFTAIVVWNYDLLKIQIWTFTQKRVKNSLKNIAIKKGMPTNYDISISKIGEDKDTQYILKAFPPSPTPKVAIDALKERPINLKALYDGQDPWSYFSEEPDFLENDDEGDPNDNYVA